MEHTAVVRYIVVQMSRTAKATDGSAGVAPNGTTSDTSAPTAALASDTNAGAYEQMKSAFQRAAAAKPSTRRPIAAPPKRSARIIALLNQKGGVGKTTTTVNLGAAIAEMGKRVCLIDLDPQSHLTLHLGIAPEQVQRTAYDLLIDPDCHASDALINARTNLDAVLSETDLAAAETELATTANRQMILREKFTSLALTYDVVLIDCPPSLGLLTLNALSLAKEVIVPMQAHFLALQGVGKLLQTVGLVCGSINPGLRVSGIVLCMHESQTTLAREIVADLDAFFTAARGTDVPWNNCRLLRPPIRRNVKLAEAPSFGKTIFDYEPTCPGANDYRMLARDVMSDAALETAATGDGVSAAAIAAATIETKPSPAVVPAIH
jgi:chromosome partitioning protein